MRGDERQWVRTNSTIIYKFVINTVGGGLSSVASATAPDGTNILNTGGWTETITSGTQFTVTHPLGQKIIGGQTVGINGAIALTRPFFSNSTGTYSIQQNSSFTQVDFWSMSATQAGYAGSGNSTVTVYMLAST